MIDLDVTRDARRARDRRVKIGGQVFQVAASARPEVIMEWEESTPDGSIESLRIMDELVVSLLEPMDALDDPRQRWVDLRSRTDDAISWTDLTEMVFTVIGVNAGRPTEASPSSTGGDASTDTSSTDGSPVEVEAT